MTAATSTAPANDSAAPMQPWQDANRLVIALGTEWLRLSLGDSAGDADMARALYEDARAELLAAEMPAAIDRLSALFELSPFDEDLLLLGLAAQQQGDIAARCAQLNGRAGAEHATLQIALALFAPDAERAALARQRLSPDAPLRRFRLIDCPAEGPALRAPLAPDERIARLLLGEEGPDARVRGMFTDPGPAVLPERYRAQIEALAARLRAAGRPLAVILGPRRSGRAAAARALAEEFGLGLAAFKPLPVDPGDALMPLVAREAALGGVALLVDPAHAETRRLLDDRIDALTIAIAEGGHDLPYDVPQLRLEPLDHRDRVALWEAALGPRAATLGAPVDALADQFRLGPSEIAEIAWSGEDPWTACGARAGRDLERLAERLAPRAGWADLVLPDEVLGELRAVTSQVRHRATVYNDHGFARRLARGGGVSVLLAGPSGTGKTMTAEVLANELGLGLFRIDLSRVISKYIGETEKNLGAVFDAAEAGGAVLFFDEADALFGKRSEVKDSHDRYANIETSYLLQRMESYGGLAILATNMKGHLDSAFLRRLRFVIDLPMPDAALRRAIWTRAFPAETPTEGLDWDALARFDIAGGNIAVIAVNAAFLAADEGAPVGMRHVAQAARAEYRKLDKEFRAAWGGGR